MGLVLVVIVAAVVVIVALGWVLTRRSRHADGVDSFRRQIDALSPQARRSTVEQLNADPAKPDPEPESDDPHDGRSHG